MPTDSPEMDFMDFYHLIENDGKKFLNPIEYVFHKEGYVKELKRIKPSIEIMDWDKDVKECTHPIWKIEEVKEVEFVKSPDFILTQIIPWWDNPNLNFIFVDIQYNRQGYASTALITPRKWDNLDSILKLGDYYQIPVISYRSGEEILNMIDNPERITRMTDLDAHQLIK